MKLWMSNAIPSAPLRVSAHEPVSLLRVAAVQHQWHADPAELRAELETGIRMAAEQGARIVFLAELTLSRYPADKPAQGIAKDRAESLLEGPTFTFAVEQAKRYGVIVHASLFEKPDDDDQPQDGRGYNTSILVSPEGTLLGKTRKLHIPITAGYYEDTYFRPGPAEAPYPVFTLAELDGVNLGLPTCWDEWFPEVARAYALQGTDVLAYPTAIGSEPEFPDFDTQPLWQHVIVGHGISNGLFMVVPNRHGCEGDITFYGSSFISDPYGRILAQASRDESGVLVADLDIAQRKEWLKLFPFLLTRRPDTYAALSEPVDPQQHDYGTRS